MKFLHEVVFLTIFQIVPAFGSTSIRLMPLAPLNVVMRSRPAIPQLRYRSTLTRPVVPKYILGLNNFGDGSKINLMNKQWNGNNKIMEQNKHPYYISNIGSSRIHTFNVNRNAFVTPKRNVILMPITQNEIFNSGEQLKSSQKSHNPVAASTVKGHLHKNKSDEQKVVAKKQNASEFHTSTTVKIPSRGEQEKMPGNHQTQVTFPMYKGNSKKNETKQFFTTTASSNKTVPIDAPAFHLHKILKKPSKVPLFPMKGKFPMTVAHNKNSSRHSWPSERPHNIRPYEVHEVNQDVGHIKATDSIKSGNSNEHNFQVNPTKGTVTPVTHATTKPTTQDSLLLLRDSLSKILEGLIGPNWKEGNEKLSGGKVDDSTPGGSAPGQVRKKSPHVSEKAQQKGRDSKKIFLPEIGGISEGNYTNVGDSSLPPVQESTTDVVRLSTIFVPTDGKSIGQIMLDDGFTTEEESTFTTHQNTAVRSPDFYNYSVHDSVAKDDKHREVESKPTPHTPQKDESTSYSATTKEFTDDPLSFDLFADTNENGQRRSDILITEDEYEKSQNDPEYLQKLKEDSTSKFNMESIMSSVPLVIDDLRQNKIQPEDFSLLSEAFGKYWPDILTLSNDSNFDLLPLLQLKDEKDLQNFFDAFLPDEMRKSTMDTEHFEVANGADDAYKNFYVTGQESDSSEKDSERRKGEEK
ncbi:hypothetical protein RUM43_004047 [Polyplax serrata]|uniref:Uncharacterized protein n=1 Tax=Polyplax serrata TaxID=468196 RepID=A0AAN8SAT2_POLSC